MPAPYLVVAALVAAYLLFTKAPALLAAIVATAAVVLYRTMSTRTDGRLLAMQTGTVRRMREGTGWLRDRQEQALLARSLKLALRQTQMFNQYPTSSLRGARLATSMGLAPA